MIRFINCIKRRKDVSIDDFRKYWNSREFEDLLQQVVDITKPESVSRNLTLDVDANLMIREERGSREPFDGIIEFWWQNGSELMDLYNSEAAREIRKKILAFQKQFVDLSESSAFFTEFH